jgi:hypothetical protein
MVWGNAVWSVRDGPQGKKVSLKSLRHIRKKIADLKFRLYATTVGYCMRGTRFCLRGRKVFMNRAAQLLFRVANTSFLSEGTSVPYFRIIGKAQVDESHVAWKHIRPKICLFLAKLYASLKALLLEIKCQMKVEGPFTPSQNSSNAMMWKTPANIETQIAHVHLTSIRLLRQIILSHTSRSNFNTGTLRRCWRRFTRLCLALPRCLSLLSCLDLGRVLSPDASLDDDVDLATANVWCELQTRCDC